MTAWISVDVRAAYNLELVRVILVHEGYRDSHDSEIICGNVTGLAHFDRVIVVIVRVKLRVALVAP